MSISQEKLNQKIVDAAGSDDVKKLTSLLDRGSDIHADNDYALRLASSRAMRKPLNHC